MAKTPNFILQNAGKQIVARESTTKGVSFEFDFTTDFVESWKNILYKQYHVKVLLKRFHLNGKTIGFGPQTQKLELLLNKQHRVKVLLKRFHLNGHIIDFVHRLKSQNHLSRLRPSFTLGKKSLVFIPFASIIIIEMLNAS